MRSKQYKENLDGLVFNTKELTISRQQLSVSIYSDSKSDIFAVGNKQIQYELRLSDVKKLIAKAERGE